MTTLVVAAHPDDEVLGCGATIAKLTDAGEDVYVAILGEGATSRWDSREEADKGEVQTLAQTAREVGEFLGVKQVDLMGLPDNRFDGVELLDIVKLVEQTIHKYSPDLIYTHHPGDLNIDHSLAHRAVLTATRPWSSHSVNAIYAFEIASATEASFNQTGNSFHPNVFQDVSATFQRKLEALSMYKDEMGQFPHPRSSENLESMAATRGSAAGFHRAEAFQLVRELRS